MSTYTVFDFSKECETVYQCAKHNKIYYPQMSLAEVRMAKITELYNTTVEYYDLPKDVLKAIKAEYTNRMLFIVDEVYSSYREFVDNQP